MMAAETFHGKHDATILPLLNKDRNEGESYCDAILQVKGVKFNVHRCLLGSLSSYFDKVFKCEMKEKCGWTVNLEKFSVETVKTILDFVYTTKVAITEETAMVLLEAADYFFLDELKTFCATFLMSTLTVVNCLQLRSIGKVYHCEMLLSGSEEVVVTHFKYIIKQPNFKDLAGRDVKAIVQALDQKVIGSKPVYEGILMWVQHDCDKRKEFFEELFKCVKLHLLQTEYLEKMIADEELVKSSEGCKDHLLREALYAMKHQNHQEPAYKSSSSSKSKDNGESEVLSAGDLNKEISSSLSLSSKDAPAADLPPVQSHENGPASQNTKEKSLNENEKAQLTKNENSQHELSSLSLRGMMTSNDSGSNKQQSEGGFAQKFLGKFSIPREPELHKAENPWTPSRRATKLTEEQQTLEILRNVRSILNKLTPSKFSALMRKFQLLPINTEIRLREVINLIFETAINERMYCEAYANMCRAMSQFRAVASADGSQSIVQSGGTVEFRKILLTRCQREFEKDRTNEEVLLQLRKEVEETKTTKQRQLAKEELEVAEAKERRRMLGNIRFIGELFKVNMLTESIMHNCVMTLFKSREEESLESLCELLTTIGKDLDHQKAKQRMDQYFTHIEKIIRERKPSNRVRFKLMDVVDLRENKWVQRAIKSQGPKTIARSMRMRKRRKLALQVAAAPPMKPQPSQKLLHPMRKAKEELGSANDEPQPNNDEVALKTSKPDTKTSATCATEKKEIKELLQKVKSVLNELTPSNFSDLMKDFQLLPINTEMRLRSVANLIFEKAISESTNSSLYVNLCHRLTTLHVSSPQSSNVVKFMEILASLCQKEVAKDRTNKEMVLKYWKKVKKAKTSEVRQKVKEEFEVAEAKERQRMLGNIRFIGELLKLKLVRESSVHNYITILFKRSSEDSLESLCLLLTTIGNDLDHHKGKKRVDQYFTQIEKITREGKTSNRIRFIFMDVLALRQNEWVQQATKDQDLKTIDQIHADVKEEKEQLALQVAAAAAAPPMKPQQPDEPIDQSDLVEEGQDGSSNMKLQLIN